MEPLILSSRNSTKMSHIQVVPSRSIFASSFLPSRLRRLAFHPHARSCTLNKTVRLYDGRRTKGPVSASGPLMKLFSNLKPRRDRPTSSYHSTVKSTELKACKLFQPAVATELIMIAPNSSFQPCPWVAFLNLFMQTDVSFIN